MVDSFLVWNWLTQRGSELGIECMGVADTELSACEPKLQAWLNNGMHGEMGYMQKHGMARLDAGTLLPGTIRIVSVRINYLPSSQSIEKNRENWRTNALELSRSNHSPYISLYARGRDYHKVIRSKLATLMKEANTEFGHLGYRVAVDSAPTPEVEIARKAGLGWRGKHTLLIHPRAGSMFFLGEIFTNLPLPLSGEFEQNHCGQCNACITDCPTGAIVEEGVVDARRCISYLTIEHESEIPLELRPLMGMRIYGCDDCQLVCPWNKFAETAFWADFESRHGFDQPDLLELLNWTEEAFLKKTEGMAMRRIGFEKFQRNLAVACGNSDYRPEIVEALERIKPSASSLVREHIDWALGQIAEKRAAGGN